MSLNAEASSGAHYPVRIDESFPKSYRLYGKKKMEAVYAKGHSFYKFPLRYIYAVSEQDQEQALEVALTVPKKKIAKAHDRNTIKRRLKEAFRKNKRGLETFLKQQNIQLSFFIVYTSTEELDFETIQTQMQKGLHLLIDTLQNEKKVIPHI